MKSVMLFAVIAALAAAGIYAGEEKEPPKPDAPAKTELKSDKDIASYALGQDFGNKVKMFAGDLNLDVMSAAFKDAVSGKEPKMKEAELAAAQDKFRAFLQAKQADPTKTPALDKKDDVSYAMGWTVGENLKQFSDSLNVDLVSGAFVAAAKGEKSDFKVEEHQAAVQAYFKKMMEDFGAKTKKTGEDFLAENKKKEGVVTTASGLQYKVLNEGKGEKPSGNDRVSVVYEGRFINGHVFDSTAKNGGKPLETSVAGGVIQGWLEALKLMPVGSKWELYIPGDLAYGPTGYGNTIPPNAVLIFQVEVVDMKKAEAQK
ncbi:MAG TPA: FKBP-type peptidyl-prolyl cis-trans isomerase [Planctomycetota bacterium]|nr:FKBP-type peptidyl-prolyl cis-trans isomerase [Planctomycetota bacterium]